MDGNHVVLDISSDEEVGFNWANSDGCGTDIDWNELIVDLQSGEGDDQNRDKGYDSDEVVVVGEVLAKPKRTKKSSGVGKLAAQNQEEEDDDCVVLSGDPDKPVAEQQDYDGDSDDLVIVAEKGQVACRDYPHPRHLCVKFPFDSTPRSDHCNLCHCFVCDSPAPCNHWASSNSLLDHCNATDKQAHWKSERKRAKEGRTSPILNATDTFWSDLLALIPTAAPEWAQNTPNPNIPVEAPSFNPPNIIRSQRTTNLSARSGYLPNPPPGHPIMKPRHNNVQRARSSGYSHPHPHPHLFPSRSISKRQTGRALLASRSGNNPFTGFKNAYFQHLLGINAAYKQKQVHRPIPIPIPNGAANFSTNQNSQMVHASQNSPIPAPSQPYPQPTSTYQNMPQFQGETPLAPRPCSEGQSGYSGDPPDFRGIELDTQFLETNPVPDFEDGHSDFEMDNLWHLL